MSAVLSINEVSMFAQPTSRAVSGAAETIRSCFDKASNAYLRDSATFSTRYADTMTALAEAASEAAIENWDGYGARPVSFAAAYIAQSFIKLLPTTFPAPEVSIDPDGEVSLDWIRSKDRMLSVSISGDGRITYAGRFGLARQSGSEIFVDEFPTNLLSCLRRLYAP